jgi:hypothetical protein
LRPGRDRLQRIVDQGAATAVATARGKGRRFTKVLSQTRPRTIFTKCKWFSFRGGEMAEFDTIRGDAMLVLRDVQDFVEGFFFEPFGIQATDGMVGFAMGAIAVIAAYAVWRLTRPAPVARYRHEYRGSAGQRRQ